MYFSGGKMLANEAFPSNTQSRLSETYFIWKSSKKPQPRFANVGKHRIVTAFLGERESGFGIVPLRKLAFFAE
jgi:hypothetical protein